MKDKSIIRNYKEIEITKTRAEKSLNIEKFFSDRKWNYIRFKITIRNIPFIAKLKSLKETNSTKINFDDLFFKQITSINLIKMGN